MRSAIKLRLRKVFKEQLIILALITNLLVWISCNRHSENPQQQSPADLVNTKIGAISHLLVPTYPTVQIPNSMVRLYPVTTPGINDNYLASRILQGKGQNLDSR